MAGGRFKVLASRHVERTPKGEVVYKKGDEFDSPFDLDEMFKNKVMRVGTANKPHPDHDDSPDASGAVMDDLLDEKTRKEEMTDMTPSVMQAKKRPRGSHEARADEGARARGKLPPEEAETEEEPAEAADFGMDVTDEFAGAADAGVQAFKGPDGYTFVRTKKPTKAVNKEPLSKKDAKTFFREKFGG